MTEGRAWPIAARRAERESRFAANRERKRIEREAITGECQICGNRQCTNRDGTMVHHGYQRPGDGYILGDCFGVGYLPYPKIDGLLAYEDILVREHQSTQAAIEDLPNVTELFFSFDPRRIWVKSETSPAQWDQKVDFKRQQLIGRLRGIMAEQVRVRDRIKAGQDRRGSAIVSFVFDDGGRAAAGFKGTTGDCVCRAIAIASGRPYAEIYEMIQEAATSERGRCRRGRVVRSSARIGVFTPTVRKVIQALGGEWHPTMRIGSGCTVHLRADELPGGRLVCSVSKHLVAVIDGIIHDIEDQSRNGTRCVYGYWRFA